MVNFGDFAILFASAEFEIGFVCRYDTTIELSSDEYEISTIGIGSATTEASGTLDESFVLSAGDGQATVVGYRLEVVTTWKKPIPNIGFHYKSCSVRQGDHDVRIIEVSLKPHFSLLS